MNEFVFSILGFILSAFICYLITPFIIKSAKAAKMTTIDAHKKNKPEITEPGGLAPLLAFIGGFSTIALLAVAFNSFQVSLFNIPFETLQMAKLLGALLSVVIAGMIGLIDDIFGISLKWRHKILLGFFPAFPLMILEIGDPVVRFPIFGQINFGLFYAFLVVPLITNFAFNSYNMLAGYNGLETGMGIVSFIAIFIIAFFVNDASVMLFSSSMIGALFMMFKFNKFPAKTLVGDTGTLMMGTGLIVALVIGNMESLGIGIFLLYLLNFLLFFVYVKKGIKQKLASIEEIEDGKILLRPPCPYTVYWFLPYYFNLTEKQNVNLLIGIQTVISGFAVILFIVLNIRII